MEKDTTQTSTSQLKETKLIHVKIIGGSEADVYEIGEALKKFKASGALPYRLEAIVTGDKVELRDVDALVRELYALKRQLDLEKKLVGKQS